MGGAKIRDLYGTPPTRAPPFWGGPGGLDNAIFVDVRAPPLSLYTLLYAYL